MTTYEYQAILPRQSDLYTVFAFCARSRGRCRFAQIDRIGGGKTARSRGFSGPRWQRTSRRSVPTWSGTRPSCPTPWSSPSPTESRWCQTGNGPHPHRRCRRPRRLRRRWAATTLCSGDSHKDFEGFCLRILCENEEELRKQFILINNTRPLPKPLIYELLPTVKGLPNRLSSRSDAAALVERLNYDEASSLRGQIKQHTNPTGVLQDTVVQVIMASLSDGALL